MSLSVSVPCSKGVALPVLFGWGLGVWGSGVVGCGLGVWFEDRG